MRILTILLVVMSLTLPALAQDEKSGWENFAHEWRWGKTIRMRTPHGWLVESNTGMCYVPDENHEWRLEK